MKHEPPDSEEVTEPSEEEVGTLEMVTAAGMATLPGLADLIVPGSGIAVAAAVGGLTTRLGRYGRRQTVNLVEELRDRVARLEEEGKLDRERLERVDELGGMQAVYANLFAVPEKTGLYADLLAGVVSTDAPDPLDLESFLETLQGLSVGEISLATDIYERWTKNENFEQQQGVAVFAGEDTRYYAKRLEGAGLLVPRLKTGPPGAGVPPATAFDPTPTLIRLIELLRSGRASAPRGTEEGRGGEPNA